MANEIEISKELYRMLESKSCFTKDAVERVFNRADSITETLTTLFNANLAKVKAEKANKELKEHLELANKSLVVIEKERKINNLSITTYSRLNSELKHMTIINHDNGYTMKGRGKKDASELDLIMNIYQDREHVKRDITLFFQLGDEIKVFENYTPGLIFKLTKINKKTVVFTYDKKTITLNRFTPTFKSRKNNKLACRFDLIKSNCFKTESDISPVEGNYHYKKYSKIS